MLSDQGSKAWEHDKMNRKGVAEFLVNYLDSNERLNVLNINAPWGAGKTFFLNNWLMQEKGRRACVYFNAWENDFTGDPFVSLVSVIREQLKETIGVTVKADTVVKDFTAKAAKAIVAATPVIAKGLVKKITGTEFDELSEVIDKDDLGEAAEKAVANLIESNRRTLDIVKDFKAVFHELLVAAAGKKMESGKALPVYIFIDELDRCRPTFSIELLERVKHLFDAQECKFIVATDTPQLAQAVKAVYGSGFDSGKYLKRFFDAEYSLSNKDYAPWVETNFSLFKNPPAVEIGHIRLHTGMRLHPSAVMGDPVAPDNATLTVDSPDMDAFQVAFLALAQAFSPQIRDLERIAMKINAMQPNVPTSRFYFFWAAYLVFLKEEASEVYNEALYGNYTQAMSDINARYHEVKLFFGSANVSVHQIFLRHLELFRAGKNAARKIAMGQRERAQLYQDEAYTAFANEYEKMALYPKLVDLSHSLG